MLENSSFGSLQAEANEALLVAIVNNSDDVIISKTLAGIITSWNPAAERLFGYTSTEAIGRHISLIIPPSRLQEEDYIISNILAGNKIDHFETYRLTKDGREVPVSVTVSPIRDSEGNIIGASKIARDISERLKSDQKQAMLASIVESSADAIISETLTGIIISWNAGAERLFGYSESEAIGRHGSQIVSQSRLDEENVILRTVAEGNGLNNFRTYRKTKSGKEIPVTISASPIRDQQGKIIGASKILRDVAGRQQAEEKQAMLAALVGSSDDAIISKTLGGIITTWNPAAQRMFGYTEQEVIGKHISIIIPRNRLSEEEMIISKISRGEKVDHFETYRLRKDGTEFPISITVSPIKDQDGKIIGASKIARDISQIYAANKALRRYSESLETINQMSREISQELELDKILQKVINATTRLTGAAYGTFFYKSTTTEDRPFLLYSVNGAPKEAFQGLAGSFSADVPEAHFNNIAFIRSDDLSQEDGYSDCVLLNKLPAGYPAIKSYMAVPVKDNSNAIVGGLFFGHPEAGIFTHDHENVVGGIAAQASIALANAKLYEEVKALNAKKDEFIGLASHELKTPLTSINGYLQLLERTQVTEKNRSFVDKTIMQAKKLNNLVGELLDVSKIEAGKLQLSPEDFDLKELIQETIEAVQLGNPSHHIDLLSELKAVSVYADRNRIEQSLINLLTNAIKYSPSADRVIVTLDETDGQARIGVRDFGIGIPADKIKHLFTRFFRADSHHPSISGLGIGLYISKEIIDRHKGKLWVESELGKGSTFWCTLPLKTAVRNEDE